MDRIRQYLHSTQLIIREFTWVVVLGEGSHNNPSVYNRVQSLVAVDVYKHEDEGSIRLAISVILVWDS